MMAASAGERGNLNFNSRYAAASDALPAPRHFEMFIDLHELLKRQLFDSDPMARNELYGDALGALLARDDGDARYWRMRSILTVWPGDEE